MGEKGVRALSETDVMNLHRSALVVDTHCDTILSLMRGRPLGSRSDEGHIDLPRLKEGGVCAQFFACFIEPQYKPDKGLRRVMQQLDAFYQAVEANADAIEVATTVADIERIHAAGKVAGVVAIEGGEAIDGDLAALRMLHKLGMRSFGLVWNQRNPLADGIGERRTHGGLTNFGVDVVKELNRLGIVVDVSHLNDEGFWDVIEVSTSPIMASHSNSRAICDHPRNLTDDQIIALAKNGGVMGMNFCPPFVAKDGKATLDQLIDHIDHIVELVGFDHVGLGSDFDGISDVPQGLENASCLPNLTRRLAERGYSDENILKILGGSHLRVLRAVWRG